VNIASRVAERFLESVIRKEKGEFCVRSPNNSDWNGGCFPSKEKAEERLKQVEFFKRQAGSLVFYHGTNHDFAKLKLNSLGVLWLAPNPRVAIQYAQAHYHKTPGYLWELTLKSGARLVDLADLKNPGIRALLDAINEVRKSTFGPLSDEGWLSRIDFGMLEQYRWASGFLRSHKVDGVFTKDTLNTTGIPHGSLALFNLRAIEKVERHSLPNNPKDLTIQQISDSLDEPWKKVARRFIQAQLEHELVHRMEHLFADWDAGNATVTAKWFQDTFRFDTTKTPKGQKKLKEDASAFHWFLRDAGTRTDINGKEYSNPRSAIEAKKRWEADIRPHASDLVRYFTDEGGTTVPKELVFNGNTYQNRVGFNEEKLGLYAKRLDSIFSQLQGWRAKALSGGVTVALTSPKDFRGTAGGKYRASEDALYIRATPNVLNREGGSYGSFEYIIAHELGHRYEHKHHHPTDFDRLEWHTTPYSRKEGEAFAELFALGQFGITQAHIQWDPMIQERFEKLMGG
jgi:hypothetical protein